MLVKLTPHRVTPPPLSLFKRGSLLHYSSLENEFLRRFALDILEGVRCLDKLERL